MVYVLSFFGSLVCLPCVVTCLFLCIVLVLPCSRHVLSYVCLSMPCALLLLFVPPPLTCSQTPGLLVLLVSPVSCYFPCLVNLCLIVCPALIVLTCPSLSVVYIVNVFLFRSCHGMVSGFHLGLYSYICLPMLGSDRIGSDRIGCLWISYLCTKPC